MAMTNKDTILRNIKHYVEDGEMSFLIVDHIERWWGVKENQDEQ